MGARFYWPEMGRFIQQDPIGDGLNWYAYVENAPLLWADPEGLLTWRDVRDWYMGGMWGASDWLDRVIMGGATERSGYATGSYYDVGCGSPEQFAGPAASWGGRVAVTSVGAYGAGKALAVGAARAPAAVSAARTKGIAGAARALTKGKIGLELGRAARPLGPDIMEQTGMPANLVGKLHQAGVKVPHVNVGKWHIIVNRYNWYRFWKWFVK